MEHEGPFRCIRMSVPIEGILVSHSVNLEWYFAIAGDKLSNGNRTVLAMSEFETSCVHPGSVRLHSVVDFPPGEETVDVMSWRSYMYCQSTSQLLTLRNIPFNADVKADV
jgi:hypothetical protein